MKYLPKKVISLISVWCGSSRADKFLWSKKQQVKEELLAYFRAHGLVDVDYLFAESFDDFAAELTLLINRGR